MYRIRRYNQKSQELVEKRIGKLRAERVVNIKMC